LSKSPEAFRTISEVAEELGVQQHVLRFWETKFPQIKPLKRGGGRRYYRPEDVDFLKHIQKLLYEDKYTIKGVQQLFREQGAAKTVARPAAELSAVRQRAIGELRRELNELRTGLLALAAAPASGD